MQAALKQQLQTSQTGWQQQLTQLGALVYMCENVEPIVRNAPNRVQFIVLRVYVDMCSGTHV